VKGVAADAAIDLLGRNEGERPLIKGLLFYLMKAEAEKKAYFSYTFTKCNVIFYENRKIIPKYFINLLPYVDTVADLGVHVYKSLTYSSHCIQFILITLLRWRKAVHYVIVHILFEKVTGLHCQIVRRCLV